MTEIRLLKCELSAEEKDSAFKALQRATKEQFAAEADRKRYAGEINQRLKAAKQRIQEANDAAENGCEMRDVEVDTVIDEKAKTVKTVRLDTNEVLETRPLEDADLEENEGNEKPPE